MTNHIFEVLVNMPIVSGSNYKAVRKALIQRANDAKNGTTWFLVLSIEYLAEIVPGFDTATRSQRRTLLIKIFSQTPLAISSQDRAR